jgi:hypothetical protein
MKLKPIITVIAALLTAAGLQAQELFVVSEPASNRPANSLGFRLSSYLNRADTSGASTLHLMPEVMLGVSKKFMVNLSVVSSNRRSGLAYEGLNLYAKYRFFSRDDVQKHFRMSLFTRLSYNNTRVHMHEINLQGHNSGHEWGLVATQLLHRTAFSGGISWLQALNNGKNNKFTYTGLDKALAWSLSAGRLLLPAAYSSYQQTNLNLMVEMLGQINLGDRRYYTDIVPSVQLIFNSQTRVDFAFRKQLSGSLHRNFTQGFLLRVEHTLFNVK